MMLQLGTYDPNEEMLESYYSSGAGVKNPIPGTVQPQQQPPVDSGAVYKVTATAKAPPDIPWGLLILGVVALVMLVRNN